MKNRYKKLDDMDVVSLKLVGNEIVKQSVTGGSWNPFVMKNKQGIYENVISHQKYRKYKDTVTRGEDEKNMIRSKKKLAELVEHNTKDILNKVIYITLTYADKKLDLKEINKDFNQFMARMRYHYAPIFGQLSFIAVPELYGKKDGYHIHCFLIAKHCRQRHLFIDWQEIREIWGFGDIKVSAPKDEISKYLIPNDNSSQDQYCKKMNKKADLQREMPKFSNMYWKSKDIALPSKIYTYNKNANEIIANFDTIKTKDFQREITYVNEETGEVFKEWFTETRYKIKNYKANHKNSIKDKDFIELCRNY